MYYQRPLHFRILDAFCRHWRLFAATMATIVLLLLAFVMLRPKMYKSEFTVVTNNQTLSNPLTQQTGGVDWNAMTETVDHFQTLVATKEFDKNALGASGVKLQQPLDFDNEDTLFKLQKGVSAASQGTDAFVVSTSYGNAQDAALIPQALIYAFIERNAEEKSAAYTQQVAFIQGQVDAYRQSLKTAEAKLADFKAENVGHLPSQQEAAEADLTNLQQQVQRDKTALSENQQQEAALQGELAVTPKTVIAQQVAGQSLLDQEITSVQQQINDDIVKQGMTMQHPLIKSLVTRLKTLNTEAVRQAKSGAGNSNITSTFTRPNPQYDSLSSQAMQLKIAAGGLQAQIADEQSLLSQTKAGVAKVPEEERQLANLTRDYQANVDNYQLFSQKLTESKLDEQINLRQNRSQYSVYMTAPPQLATSKGKTTVLLLGGIILAVVVSSGLVILLEMMDRSFRDPLDLQRTLGVPVLAVLPESPDLNAAGRRSQKLLGGPSGDGGDDGARMRLGFGRSLRRLNGPAVDERMAAAVEPIPPHAPDHAAYPDEQTNSSHDGGGFLPRSPRLDGAGGAAA